jgi:glutamate---cysteine ligase / carboxylate-amine ligase
MSLREHEFTIGVEEEYQIIDPHTRELSQSAHLVLPKAQDILGEDVQYEMILSQIEIATPICHTLQEVQNQLIRLRSGVINAAEEVGVRIGAAGTHPFSHWRDQQVTPRPRYQELIDTYRQSIREQVINGCHVHVGLPDREMATKVLNHARTWLAPLLALSANSPYWLGDDTGYDNYRTSLWWTVPLSGPPPSFQSYEHYCDTIRAYIDAKVVEEGTRVYWDLRLSERFPTIEFRVMDVCMRVETAVTLVGVIRALVRTCYEMATQNVPHQEVSSEFLKASHWCAARYGLHGELIDIQGQRSLPAALFIEQMLEFLRPALEAEGDWQRVTSGVQKILHEGNDSRKQQAVYQQTGSFHDVVDFVISETKSF